MRDLRRAALALTLSVAALPAAVAVAGADIQTLSHADSSASLSVGTDQSIRATWVESDPNRDPAPTSIADATAQPGASAFGPARSLMHLSTKDDLGGVTSDGHGGHVLVWSFALRSTRRVTHNLGLLFSIVRPDGTRTPRRRLSTPRHRAVNSAVAGNAAGDTVACWRQRDSAAHVWRARCAIRRAGSDEFGPARTLAGRSRGSGGQLYPLLSDSGRLLVINEIEGRIMIAQGSLVSGLGAGELIEPEGQSDLLRFIGGAVAPDGSATVAWEQLTQPSNRPQKAVVRVVRLAADGRVARRQQLSSLPFQHDGEPDEALDAPPTLTTLGDGSTLLAFAGIEHVMVTRAPADPAAPFPAPLPLGATGVVNASPILTAGPGTSAALTWTLDSTPFAGASQPSVVQLARYDGSSWGGPTSVSAPTGHASDPAVALTPGGAAALTWADQGLQARIIR